MEFPPDDWIVLPDDEFELAAARDPGQLGVDLLAQVRPNGRLLDHFKFVLGGTEIIEATFKSSDVFLFEGVPEVVLHFNIWPRDIKIRRNMASSDWLDLAELLAANDVVGEGGASNPDDELVNPVDELKHFISTRKDKSVSGSSLRWAVGIGADKRLELSLQLLPGSAGVLNSKPTLRG